MILMKVEVDRFWFDKILFIVIIILLMYTYVSGEIELFMFIIFVDTLYSGIWSAFLRMGE